MLSYKYSRASVAAIWLRNPRWMSSNSGRFPSPVGGVPLSQDFVPSIVFTVLYALLLPVFAYRLYKRESRTLALFRTMAFCIERVVVFSLRADRSRPSADHVSETLVKYMQVTWAGGFVGIGQDLVLILRAFLVKSTKIRQKIPSYEYVLRPARLRFDHDSSTNEIPADNPRERFWVRRACDVANLATGAAHILSAVGGILYWKATHSRTEARLVQRLRYAGTALILLCLVSSISAMLWACMTRRVARKPALYYVVIAFLLVIVSIYRLVIMRFQTLSLLSTAAGSLNSSESKATFYILHMAPEWIAVVLLLCINVRETFGTGLIGDWRATDRQRREAAAAPSE